MPTTTQARRRPIPTSRSWRPGTRIRPAARRRAADLGVPYHADLAELLARPDVDGVIVTTRTTAHRDVIIAAAEAGKHVFTEKVLALTPAEAREIVDAVERRAVRLVVSLPRLSHGYTLAIRDILASGRLGEVTRGPLSGCRTTAPSVGAGCRPASSSRTKPAAARWSTWDATRCT